MQSDRPLASYRCGLYANSFLRDDQERNHTSLWKVDLVDGLPGLLDNRPLLERRGPKARFKKRKSLRGESREQPVLEMSVGLLLYHHILHSLRGERLFALARSSCPPFLTRTPFRTIAIAIAILVVDYVLYIILFSVGNFGIGTLNEILFLRTHVNESLFDYLRGSFSVLIPAITLDPSYFMFYWAGFAPSIWLWLYVAALFVTRGLLRSEKLVNWLRWFLDVEKNPFRSIGAVAAALAFIASVAIILVSAEVSRISAAA